NAAHMGPICKWVNNFLAFCLPGQSWTEDDFIGLTAVIGIPWGAQKTKMFASMQHYIGFNWDIEAKTVAVPLEKLNAMTALVDGWFAKDAKFSAHDAQRLHGKLVHISCIFPLIR
ncbi:hypothetical protein NEOLEDRAFT_1025855, partial [Neolentinus lepideus HHB14362 ss-1]